jgi:hypothetical protein
MIWRNSASVYDNSVRIRTRRFFFYLLVAIFIVAGGFLALTAGGWVINLNHLSITKTGAIFLKYSPDNARIYLRGVLNNASPGFLSSGVFLPNLAPGNYPIRITAPGYEPWVGDLTVQPGLVTAASEIQLWPETWPLKSVLADPAANFYLTGAGAVIQTASDTLLFGRKTIPGYKVILSDPGTNTVVTANGESDLFTDLTNPQGRSINITSLFNSLRETDLALPGKVPITNLFFHPFSSSRLILTSANGVYELDLRQPRLSLLIQTNGIAAVAVSGNEVFVIDTSGTLSIFNLLLQTETSFPLGVTDIAKMSVTPSGNSVFFLKKNGLLLKYDRNAQKLTPLMQNVSDFWLSPGEERMAVRDIKGKLNILALKEFWGDDKVSAGEAWLVSFPGGSLDSFAWLPDYPNYGLVLADGKLSVVELGSRVPQNASVIAKDVSKFYLSGSNLFVLQGNALQSVDLGNF